MRRVSIYALAVGLFLAAGLASNGADAFCRMTTEDQLQVGNSTCSGDGIPLEWRDACLQYSIDARGSFWMDFGDVESAISASFETWENQTCDGGELANVIFTMGPNSTCQKIEFIERGPNVNTIAFLDPWEREDGEALPANAFALTNVWFREDTGQILDADMLINETLGPYDNCPDSGCPPGTPGNPGPADLQSIVTHEAGHFIGIGHSDVGDATMFASAPRTEVTKRTLAADDIDAVCTIYPPGNLNASCDSTPMGGLDLNCEDGDPPPASGSGGGCSAAPLGQRLPWETAAIALLALMALRRRFLLRDARY